LIAYIAEVAHDEVGPGPRLAYELPGAKKELSNGDYSKLAAPGIQQ
jgi:hypothetical protein